MSEPDGPAPLNLGEHHPHQLRRSVGTATATATSAGLAFAAINFIGVVSVATYAAGSSAWLAILIGGLIALIVSGVFSELNGMWPTAAGVRLYIASAFGGRAALIVTFTYMSTVILVIAADAFLIGAAIQHVFGQPPVLAYAWILLLLLVATLLNLRGITMAGRVQSIVTYTVLASTVLISVVAITRPGTSFETPFALFGNGALSGFQAIAFALFLFAAFEWVTTTAEEARTPGVITRALFIAPVLIWLAATVFALGLDHLVSKDAAHSSAYPQLLLGQAALGRLGVIWMLAVTVLTAINTFNGGFLVASRFVYAAAREGNLPRAFAGLNMRAVPWLSVVVLAAVSAVVAAVVFATGQWLLLVAVGAALEASVFAIASVALLRLRRTEDRPRPFRLRGAPVLAGFGAVLFAGLALASGLSDPESPSQFSPIPALVVLTLAALSTAYVLFVVPRLHRAAAARRAAARASGERVRRRPPRPAADPVEPTPDLAAAVPADWWKSAVVYQVYPRSFADSDGDGIGDLRGIIGRLDYLAELGIDVVWLSPAYRSPQDDNGYDISDYQDIDPLFGKLADIDDLIAGLHERGIRLVMDLVVNHTSDEHPWFVESRSSRDNPKRDWYWWRPARPGHESGALGAEPTNWKSFFSGPTWEYDAHTGEYFLHLFTRRQPDLNWENPEVRGAVYSMMNWWVDRGVDGFRMDVINLISKDVAPDGSLADGVVPDGDWLGAGWPLVANGPRVHEFLHEMNVAVLTGRNLVTVGETPGVTIDDARRYTDPASAEVDMVFQFEHMSLDQAPGGDKWDLAPLRLTDLKRNLDAWQIGLAESGWNSLYWDNHDQPRIVSRWGDDGPHRVVSAKTLATVLHLMRGTPYVYQGEELGMTNAHFTALDQYRDVEALNYAAEAAARGIDEAVVLRSLAVKSRDNARTPMQWDDGPHAGFTTGEPWLAVNPNHVDVNAAAAVADPDSVFHHYRRLIALRHEHPVIVHGDFGMLVPEHEQVFAYTRTLGTSTLLVVANMSGDVVTADIGDSARRLDGEVLISTHPTGLGTPSGSMVRLRPWESLATLSI